MQGEFRGDFTRDTFDPRNHYLRVLMQQGRVQLDADWNEQTAILLRYLQALAEDIIGAHGGPIRRLGFEIFTTEDNQLDNNNVLKGFKISTGRYYVNGILCENNRTSKNPKAISYYEQPDYPLNSDKDKIPLPVLVYLDVWERHITYVEDNYIREVALGGADTTTRSKVIWQVKVQQLGQDGNFRDVTSCTSAEKHWDKLLKEWQSPNRGLLKARVYKNNKTEPCIVHPDLGYQGVENQLYRVEIHKGGEAGQATFKWSRENGSVVFAIAPVMIPDNRNNLSSQSQTVTVTLHQWWRDERFGLKIGNWVEIVDDEYVLHQLADPLWQVEKIDPEMLQVTLKRHQPPNEVKQNFSHNCLLRRWDHKQRHGVTLSDGAIKIVEEDDTWVAIEDGVQIQFQKASTHDGQSTKHTYRTGDYWLIPARTATGDIEWPIANGKPEALLPHGIQHHYAPLAIVSSRDGNLIIPPDDCRRRFYSLARTYDYVGSGDGIGAELLWQDDG